MFSSSLLPEPRFLEVRNNAVMYEMECYVRYSKKSVIQVRYIRFKLRPNNTHKVYMKLSPASIKIL